MAKIKLQALLNELETYLKCSEFKDYGPNGLQIEGRQGIDTILFSPSVSSVVIQKAIDLKADAIMVHHGLFWDKESKVLEGPLLKKVAKLITHNISLIAYHLPLDAHPEVGNNFQTLQALGAAEIESFEGVGAQGFLDMPSAVFLARVEKFFEYKPLVPPLYKKQLTRVACVTGGGHSYFKAACALGVDAFITGTCDEWVWGCAQENQVLFIPVGHYRSEKIGIGALGQYIEDKWGVKAHFFAEKNPY